MLNINEIKNRIILSDSLEILKQLPDKCIELVLTDPPYGINIARSGQVGGNNKAAATDYGAEEWDAEIPSKEFFDEIFRVSKNQIIFGGNYFVDRLGVNSPCWIVWDKNNSGNFAPCELAFTSFKCALKKYVWTWNGMLQENMKDKEIRIHPTQKPVGLLKQILADFYDADSGGIVADFFSGSASTAVACAEYGIPFVAVEKNETYYKKSVERLKDTLAQTKLFSGLEMLKSVQNRR